MQQSDRFGDTRQVGWLIGLATVGNRSEIGGIGFDEDAVERAEAGHIAHFAGVFKGDESGKSQIKTKVENS